VADRTERTERAIASAEAVGGIHEAALDGAAWPRAAAAIAAELRARAALVVAIDPTSFTIGFRAAAGLSAAATDEYARAFARIDPLLAAAARRPECQAWRPDDFMTRREWTATPVHRRFLAPNGLSHAIAGVAARDEGAALACLAWRTRAAGPFGADERMAMAALLPHLARAARIRRRIEQAEGMGAGLAEAMARMPLAAILCDRSGRALWMNPQAEELMRRREGLRLGDGRVEAANGLGAELRRLIAGGAAAEGNGRSNGKTNGRGHGRNGEGASGDGAGDRAERGVGGWLQLPRPWPKKPLSAHVIALPAEGGGPGLALNAARPAALILIGDPERPVRVPPDQLARALGLTGAEARLAAALAAGSDVAGYAARAHITVGTARWYLKQALSKTGTHRQSELVRQVTATTEAVPIQMDAIK
jgi:DNA-binding CsgD family transcriptional regulator/PAS domain-containing protein